MSDLEPLLKQRADAEELIARRAMATRLANNPDFKKLILQEFCVEECARYAQTSGDPALSAAQRADALAISQSAGHLRRWLQIIGQMGLSAQNQLESLDDAITEARAEQDAT